MSEPLFTIVTNPNGQTFFEDFPPDAIVISTPSSYAFIKKYVIIQSGDIKYRMYLLDSEDVQITSEDNSSILQSNDSAHNYFAGFFKAGAGGILTRDTTEELQPNEIVVNGQDLYFPFEVQGFANIKAIWIAQQAVEDAQLDAMVAAAQQAQQSAGAGAGAGAGEGAGGPNAPQPLQIILRF